MSAAARSWRRYLGQIAAISIVAMLYVATRAPVLDEAERIEIAREFSFSSQPLEEPATALRQDRRPVNPMLERHAGWISAVGAAVALADLDADGLANDVCHVDPLTDLVTLAPVPGTGARYPLMVLDASSLEYDSSSMAPMGCIPTDANEDGLMDVLVYYWGRTPVLFLRRSDAPPAPTRDAFAAREISGSGERWYTNAATFADLDSDGHLDLVLGNYFQDGARIIDASADQQDSMQHSMSRAYNGGRNRVFRWREATRGSSPDVRFEEVEGLFDDESDHAWTLAIGAADLDGDLRPELYYANDFGPDRLFHNRSQPGKIRFALIEGHRTLTMPRSKVLGRDSFKGMGVDFADINGDGLLDFFVSNIAAEYALLESHFMFVSSGDQGAMQRGEAPYSDDSERLGVARSSWGWDTRFGDFNNDGVSEALQATGFAKGSIDRWPELQELATANDELLRFAGAWPRFQAGDDLCGQAPNAFYVLTDDGRYYDLSVELGLDRPQVSRGIATADVDGDGDLDFAVANQWETSYFHRNELARAGAPRPVATDEESGLGAGVGAPGDIEPERSDFIGLRLYLPIDEDADFEIQRGSGGTMPAGRPAIGASVRVSLSDGRILVGQVDGGNGHSGVRSPELHFGLGESSSEPTPVSIRYRNRTGEVQSLELTLRPGWHSVILPDEKSILALARGDAS